MIKYYPNWHFWITQFEKLRNIVHREKYLIDVVNDDWFYGKMQISLGINNMKDNSVLVSTN